MFFRSTIVMLLFAILPLSAQTLPRTADGKPNLQGIWQVRNRASYDLQDHVAKMGMPAGKGIVEGGAIPYQSQAAAKKLENFNNRKTADPLNKCFMPGVPRIMYMEFPFQIFQTPEHVALTFEWQQVHRLIYLNTKKPAHGGVDSWMGDSRGHWEGNTRVVEVKEQNDQTWLDMAGDFHSEDMLVVERYTLRDPDTIDYEATLTDPKTFTRPWKISMPLIRQKEIPRLLEYQCQAEVEEANGDFEPGPRTWYSPDKPMPPPFTAVSTAPPLPPVGTDIRRTADGKPDLTGFYNQPGNGANYGLERARGVIIDPPGGKLPYQDWARAEHDDRNLPQRGYDDPTAHCIVAGVPRSHYVPSPIQIIQPPGYVVVLSERMSWRQIFLDGRAHLPDNVRLWQGDSVGHWEGDVLVVDSTNFNGKTWLNEAGDVVSYAEHVVEQFVPVSADKIMYRATVYDPIAYTQPWTIQIPLNRQPDELLEVACHEDNGDLEHLKAVKDAFRAQQKKEK
ncbi:MAG TPA: hypothetical protein VGK48_15010 [Terriglobia bacterium]